MDNLFPGVIEDTRTSEQKEKDYKHAEVAMATPVNWVEKTPEQWRKFPIFMQDGSGSCVAQGLSKVLGIMNVLEEGEFIHLSARDIYAQRQNQGAGMWFVDALNIARKNGCIPEAFLPSQNLNEEQMNVISDRRVYKQQMGKVFSINGFVQFDIQAPDLLEQIASVMANGTPALLGFTFNYDEWKDVPEILTTTPSLRHGVAGTDFGMYQGKKGLVIDDSWGQFYGFKGQRFITEEFLKARCIFAGYVLDLKNNWRDNIAPPKPHYVFNRTLRYGATNDPDVKALQDILKYEELFPQTQTSTGNYFEITRKGVVAFNTKYGITESTDGKMVGVAGLQKLNQLYGS